MHEVTPFLKFAHIHVIYIKGVLHDYFEFAFLSTVPSHNVVSGGKVDGKILHYVSVCMYMYLDYLYAILSGLCTAGICWRRRGWWLFLSAQ